MTNLKANVIREFINAYAWSVMYDKILYQDEIDISNQDREYYNEKYRQHLQLANAMCRVLPASDFKKTVPDARFEAVEKGQRLFEQWMTNNRKEKTA